MIGGILWVSVCVFAGYFFGNLPFVKKNFSVVVIAIVLISLLPAVIEYLRHRAGGEAKGIVAWPRRPHIMSRRCRGATGAEAGRRCRQRRRSRLAA